MDSGILYPMKSWGSLQMRKQCIPSSSTWPGYNTNLNVNMLKRQLNNGHHIVSDNSTMKVIFQSCRFGLAQLGVMWTMAVSSSVCKGSINRKLCI